MWLMYFTPSFLIYTLSYLIWSVYLGYNHPLPYVSMSLLPTWGIFNIGLWIFLPSGLLSKKDFRQKLLVYMAFNCWSLIAMIQKEILSYLFSNLPPEYQFTVAFMIAACRELELLVRSKLVTMMVGQPDDEPAIVILEIDVQAQYAFFINIRLADATFATIFAIVAIDFVCRLKTTIQINNEHKKVTIEEIPNQNKQKSIYITQLIIGELIVGLTPIVYGTGMTMAYYGPNANLLTNVGSDFWGGVIEDMRHLFYPMFILVTFDSMSVVVTSICLWKLVDVNMAQKFCRTVDKYWLFMVVKISMAVSSFFATIDVNLGNDISGEFKWITPEGRQSLIYSSNYLTDEEKASLFTNNTLI